MTTQITLDTESIVRLERESRVWIVLQVFTAAAMGELGHPVTMLQA